MALLDPIAEIMARAELRRETLAVAYRGAVTPDEAWQLVSAGAARLLDVRTAEELALVGRVPGAEEIEFKQYPDWRANPRFLDDAMSRIAPDETIVLLCRSAARSHDAAILLTEAGYANCFNVLEGFEGDKNAASQRTVNGWKNRGLPWQH